MCILKERKYLFVPQNFNNCKSTDEIGLPGRTDDEQIEYFPELFDSNLEKCHMKSTWGDTFVLSRDFPDIPPE